MSDLDNSIGVRSLTNYMIGALQGGDEIKPNGIV